MKFIQQLNEASQRIPRIIQDIGKEIGSAIKTADEAQAKNIVRKMVNKYYSQEVWSTEKEEWQKLSAAEKDAVVNSIISRVKK